MERRYFIDWLRVLAFVLLIFFHCAMPFVTFGWEIKDTHQSYGLTRLIMWLHQWRLPLLFFISGVGIHFSLRRRSVLSFAGERVIRLFIPLVFAMFFTIPWQVYFEWLQTGRINGSFIQFYPQVWEMVPYPEGALTWSHMWFVVYLFVFCILLLPVFALFKISAFQRLKSIIADKLSHPLVLPFLFIPLSLYYFTLFIDYPAQGSLLDDWFLFCFSITLLFFGFIMTDADRFWQSCEKYRFFYLAIAILCICMLYVQFWWELKTPQKKGIALIGYGVFNAIHIWLLILAATGFAKKHLNFNNRFIEYANQAVYPFYILHQTIIVAVGYFVVQLNIPIAIKIIILLLSTFGSISVIYAALIKPFIATRILYGLKPKERKNPKVGRN